VSPVTHRAKRFLGGAFRGGGTLKVALRDLFEKAATVLDIVVRGGAETGDFLRRNGADDPPRGAHHNRPWRDRFSFRDERVSSDQAVVANHSVVQDYRADADQAVVANPAPVQKRAVPDGAAAPDLEGQALVGVEDAMLLNIGLVADLEILVVAAKHGPIPNGHATAEGDFADDIRVWSDKKIADGGKCWGDTVESQNRHGEYRQSFRSSARMAIWN